MGGWVAGLLKNKAISASNEVEVEAELGNMCCQKVLVYRKGVKKSGAKTIFW